MKPVLSLVVLGYRNFDAVTKNCLESLLPWAASAAVEIWVVDNGSPDDSAAKTRAWCEAHPGFRCLISKKNLGFAGGMNWGASHAQGDWLLLVNNDTVFPALALDALELVVQNAPPKVAMLGPVTNAAGNGQRLWKPEADHAQWLQIGKQLHENPSKQLMPAYRCDFFCIAIRRTVWEQLGGLDTVFGLGYYEDFDFSLRLRNAGFEQKITEDVFVLHAGSATFQGSKEARALIKKNKKLLQSKHPNARFEHTRMGNLAVLEAYAVLKQQNQWSDALAVRRALRVAALVADAPRSLIKRWLWGRRVKYLNIF
ncbi:glycosyltransferase family 2 protein [Curvibacter sp. CHRR-16]|uniref:glycosyltransferase family 2 protein n=1 Tax=Curvibacter sp. CHRR-16 TaxID=2835872 RepID=UPI001BDA7900|nr:glycosyltransferase family 2 protein [Curvibacter sp. CHRR-16]MBT0569358.1 glycosyltransferase family 2 protein [Curvibacter sp. CHRR-16]